MRHTASVIVLAIVLTVAAVAAGQKDGAQPSPGSQQTSPQPVAVPPPVDAAGPPFFKPLAPIFKPLAPNRLQELPLTAPYARKMLPTLPTLTGPQVICGMTVMPAPRMDSDIVWQPPAGTFTIERITPGICTSSAPVSVQPDLMAPRTLPTNRTPLPWAPQGLPTQPGRK